MEYFEKLDGLLKAAKINASTEPLAQYLSLLIKWNKAYNLTAIRDPYEMMIKHLLDSLSFSAFIKGPNILDFGTGAGLPGIPLAIMHPEYQFVLLDSNGKKTRFLQAVKRELNLNNVEIIHSRAESYHPEKRFDTLTCRAVSEIENLIRWTQHLLSEQGQWALMKGKSPETELIGITLPYEIISYPVYGLDETRHCVRIQHHYKD
jgi:16S rRNA (guanine527-N7)-methyltransferase